MCNFKAGSVPAVAGARLNILQMFFWTRWVREYLPLLQARQRWMKPQRNIAVGDLVLVRYENTPRHQWPLDWSLKCIPEQTIRSDLLKSASGDLITIVHAASCACWKVPWFRADCVSVLRSSFLCELLGNSDHNVWNTCNPWCFKVS